MSRLARPLFELRLAVALLVLLPGCFSEPEPIDDDGGTVMCIQAPCTATEGPGSTGPEPTATDATGSSAGPSESSESSAAASSSSSDGVDSTGVGPICGDGEVNQPSEMCDSTGGCLDDCTFESYDCNPLNDADCIEGLRCGAVDVPEETFGCMPIGAGGVGSPCSGIPTNDGQCDAGLTCLFNFNTPLCDEGDCCVEYCDLTDAAFRCSGGAVCRQFFIDPVFQGLEHLGFCGEPS